MDGSKGLWFLTGIGFGALVGILYAPRAGEETRELLNQKTDEGLDFVKTKGSELRDQASQAIDRGKETFGRTVDRGKEVVNRQKEQVQAAVDAGKQAYRETSVDVRTGS